MAHRRAPTRCSSHDAMSRGARSAASSIVLRSACGDRRPAPTSDDRPSPRRCRRSTGLDDERGADDPPHAHARSGGRRVGATADGRHDAGTDQPARPRCPPQPRAQRHATIDRQASGTPTNNSRDAPHRPARTKRPPPDDLAGVDISSPRESRRACLDSPRRSRRARPGGTISPARAIAPTTTTGRTGPGDPPTACRARCSDRQYTSEHRARTPSTPQPRVGPPPPRCQRVRSRGGVLARRRIGHPLEPQRRARSGADHDELAGRDGVRPRRRRRRPTRRRARRDPCSRRSPSRCRETWPHASSGR